MEQLTVDQKAKLGALVIELLHLKAKGGRIETSYGAKTPQGLGATIERLINDVVNEQSEAPKTDKITINTNPDKIAIIWSVEDVIDRAEDCHEMGVSIEQSREVLRKMEHYHDCNYGLTWGTIDSYLDEIKTQG
jgi:hypothetical protein